MSVLRISSARATDAAAAAAATWKPEWSTAIHRCQCRPTVGLVDFFPEIRLPCGRQIRYEGDA